MTGQTEVIARQAFAEIAVRFPHLEIIENLEDPVEISLTLPQQTGLKYPVWLAFQNEDELHFSVGHFWLAWFPCTKPERVEQYVGSVCGFLSGQYRVIEQYRGQYCFKAELQRPSSNGWETLGTWSRFCWPSFQQPAVTELINA